MRDGSSTREEVEVIQNPLDHSSKMKSPAGRKVKAASPFFGNISRESTVENSPTHRFERDSILLVTRTIDATNDIAPVLSGPKPTPFLYRPRHKDYLCALTFIKRYPDLTAIAEKHYTSALLMTKKWATLVKTKANNERAVQIRYIKMIWLSLSSSYSLATNVLEAELNNEVETEIMLTPAVEASGISTVAELRNLIKSPTIYTNSVVFNLFCSGLESGVLKMSRPKSPTRLGKLITIVHEAHFRLEIWLALKKQGFRHNTTTLWTEKRRQYWTEFCKLVAQDRKDLEETASISRIGGEV
jgi:hypothetical protein